MFRCSVRRPSVSLAAAKSTLRPSEGSHAEAVYAPVDADLSASSNKESWSDFKTHVPQWAYNQKVADLAEKESEGKSLSMRLCSGPGIQMARCGTALLWVSLLAITIAAYHFQGCSEDGKVAVMPLWIWLLWVPALVVCFILELECLKLTTIPYWQALKHFKILKMQVSFRVWCATMFCMSFLHRLDMATDGFFVANSLADANCRGDRLGEVWQIVMQKSVFRNMGLDQILQFHRVVAASFCFLGIQLVYALLQSTHRDPCGQVDYIIGNKNEDGSDAVLNLTTVLGEERNFGDALHILGESMGAASLTSQKPSFPQKKADLLLEAEHVPDKDVDQALDYVRNCLVQGTVLLGSIALTENAFQINLQVSVFAMKRALSKDSLWQYHWMTKLASLCLCLVMSLEKIKVGIDLLRSSNDVCRRVTAAIRSGKTARSEKEIRDSKAMKLVDRYFGVMVLILCILVLATLYAVAKFVAVFLCDDSVWNVTGCVNIDRDSLRRFD